MEYPLITEFMAKRLITFTPETPIEKAIKIMLRKKISGAPVLNQKKEIVGMLSEMDCLKMLVGDPVNRTPTKSGMVGDYMSTEIQTINANQTVWNAAFEFVHRGFKRLPVVDNGRLVGQISRSDVMRFMHKFEPKLKLIPDSWKLNVPAEPDHKKSRFNSKN